MRIVVKIFLILSLICSGVTIAILSTSVQKRVTDAETARDKNAQELDAESAAKTKAEGERDMTKMELDTTKATLQTTEANLVAKTKDYEDERAKASDLGGKLAAKTGELDKWKRDHQGFVELNRTPEQILQTEADLKKTTEQRNAFDKENKMLSQTVNGQKNEIGKLRNRLGLPTDPLLPPGLAGKVIAVDPKYQFVVLDIGNKEGAQFPGEMIVVREGKLVGKVRIDDVKGDHSVANILKEWKQKDTEILEGDLVMVEANK
jgi:hypothetical protein